MLKNIELFGYAPLETFLDERYEAAMEYVENLSREELLEEDAETLHRRVLKTFEDTAPVVRPHEIDVEPHEADNDPETGQTRIVYTVGVPYTGSPELFMYTPRDWDGECPLGFLLGRSLCRQIQDTGQSSDELRRTIDVWLASVRAILEPVRDQFEEYLPRLRKNTIARIRQRQRALSDAEETVHDAGLGNVR